MLYFIFDLLRAAFCLSCYVNTDEIQLIYQGKVLLEGSTLEEVDVQPNDTLIAVIPALQDDDEVQPDNEQKITPDDGKYISCIIYIWLWCKWISPADICRSFGLRL